MKMVKIENIHEILAFSGWDGGSEGFYLGFLYMGID